MISPEINVTGTIPLFNKRIVAFDISLSPLAAAQDLQTASNLIRFGSGDKIKRELFARRSECLQPGA